ncbi:heme peroxidase family protein [uncultured Methylobacterium sp.]|uniref:peroxidase family protein n=1 Tax=uncultured Methylobacterium sp. TaxID=157278 RepID=UPI0035CBC7D4
MDRSKRNPNEQPAHRPHGRVRGLGSVDRSSREGTRFGRMFRWLPGETYDKADLVTLAEGMIQAETAKVVPPGSPEWKRRHRSRGGDHIEEGPSAAFNPVPPLLDTAYTEPEPGDENPTIPAGYTYFGQFIDHDLTFDPNSSLQKQNDPDATEDFRTPRFDLDSLYGRGPDDQPYLYKDRQADGGGIRFLLGRQADGTTVRPGELPRNVEGRALTGDPRNDENNLICQVQAVFLNFHNKVVDTLSARSQLRSRHDIFLEAQRIVRWHYQYLVLNDYLPRIVGDEVWRDILGADGKGHPHPKLTFYKPKHGQAYMPVEFSVAAFRFGHSMVRPSYALRANDARVGGDPTAAFARDKRFHRIPIFSLPAKPGAKPAPGTSLNGFGPLPPDWEIDWGLFFSAGEMPTQLSLGEVFPKPDGKPVLEVLKQTDAQKTQPGYRIDTQLVDPLAMLPPDVAKSGNMPDGIPSLAYRNLLRGSAFELPSGQNVARAYGLTPLDDTQLWGDFPVGAPSEPPEPAIPLAFPNLAENPFAGRAPLWFYILKEAEVTRRKGVVDAKGGHHLGAVGGRIVAEVLVGIAQADHSSYLYQDPNWTPAAEKDRSGFDPKAPLTTLFELIHWTTGGAMTFRPAPAAPPPPVTAGGP